MSELPFTLALTPEDLPAHAHIEAGAPHWDSIYAVSTQLDADWVQTAYERGLFPWYSPGEPVLWHSPQPRMVLDVADFHLSHSLKKRLRQWARTPELGYRVTLNRAFDSVMQSCANIGRAGQNGTWISDEIQSAYGQLHQREKAISVELWHDDRLIAGLYGVLLGRMFFGESMFTHVNDGSKVALACWVAHWRRLGGQWLDCQQVTTHLHTLGARPIERSVFFRYSHAYMNAPAIAWTQLNTPNNLLDYFAPDRQPTHQP